MAETCGTILLVDDDRAFRLSTAELLRQEGHSVLLATNGSEAAARLKSEAVDLMLLDLRMPGLGGLAVVEALRAHGEGVPILMISGFGTVESAVQALHLGVDDFLTKPVDPDMLNGRIAELLERRPTSARLDEVRQIGIVGQSRGMHEVLTSISRVAPTETTVLVSGETGTGKELVARAIHHGSRRSAGPFVAVNCASLAEGVLESELFGHARGAFTGAVRDRPGVFEAARGGTILLDEVGDVSLRLQQSLLRVLQEREVVPVGETSPRSVDVRVVAATNRDLEEETGAGRFRRDLFYRLNVFNIHLPPLRDRPGDIALLAETALQRVSERLPHHRRLGLSPLAMRLLRSHDWPGNVRELFAAVESAAIRAESGTIQAHHLPAAVRERSGAAGEERYQHHGTDEEERTRIERVLRETGGVKTVAADRLGMSRTTLWRKIRHYGLDADHES